MVVKADFRQEKFSVVYNGRPYTVFRFENLHDGNIIYDIKDISGIFSKSVSPNSDMFKDISREIEFQHTSK